MKVLCALGLLIRVNKGLVVYNGLEESREIIEELLENPQFEPDMTQLVCKILIKGETETFSSIDGVDQRKINETSKVLESIGLVIPNKNLGQKHQVDLDEFYF